MEYVVLITVLILLHYMYLGFKVGGARGKYDVKAPATTGNEIFERHMRAHMNTLEQLVMTLPALWLCAYFFRADVAAILGAIFLIGRVMYAIGYVNEPSKRGNGMMIGFVASLGLLGCSLFGAFF
ncbi:MAG TPA: MAPEG family protein [Gammaproteobacteria bacterium]|jgi:glutathione S-transferase|nr:MAPEG family protein [Gammaproteobacteria bacterium]